MQSARLLVEKETNSCCCVLLWLRMLCMNFLASWLSPHSSVPALIPPWGWCRDSFPCSAHFIFIKKYDLNTSVRPIVILQFLKSLFVPKQPVICQIFISVFKCANRQKDYNILFQSLTVLHLLDMSNSHFPMSLSLSNISSYLHP